MKEAPSKLQLDGERVIVTTVDAIQKVETIFVGAGCSKKAAKQVAEHLADSSLCGMESHGLMRVLQYYEQFQSGYMTAAVEPRLIVHDNGIEEIDGSGGHGVPAMYLAVDHAIRVTKERGISALAVRNVGHTGRLGAFTEMIADQGCLSIMFGGGNRKKWRQVAPYGGRKALLPTNPYCIAIPGGELGPVVLDFATSKIAGGWVYAARSAGARLPEGALVDPEGNPSTDPEDYFRGGAILPAGDAKGYALALVAEIMAEALLGPTTTEASWLMITIDCSRYREPSQMRQIAEEILSEIRDSPPAVGFDSVQVPGERERKQRELSNGLIGVPERTWVQITELADSLSKKSALN